MSPRKIKLGHILAVTGLVALSAMLALVIALRQGVSIDSLQIGNTLLKQTQVRWEQGLVLRIAEINRTGGPATTGDDASLIGGPSHWRQVFSYLDLASKWMSELAIDAIRLGNIRGSLHWQTGGAGQLQLESTDFKLQCALSLQTDGLHIDIRQLDSRRFNSQLHGQLLADPETRLLSGKLEARLADTLPLAIDLSADQNQLRYQARGTAPITSIVPIVSMFELSPAVKPWLTDHLDGSGFRLVSAHGSIPLDDPAQALDTLVAEAVVDNPRYTFAPGLQPIEAMSAQVVFRNRVLEIRPQKSTFYGQGGGDSWLDIDFTATHPVLTARIKTRARADHSIRQLLAHYDISFPFIQQTGLTETDLTLAIDLAQLHLRAYGQFVLPNGRVEYDGRVFDVTGLEVGLQNSDIDIRHLRLALDDLFTAQLQGRVNPASATGDLRIELDHLDYPVHGQHLTLANEAGQPLALRYRLDPAGDTVDVSASRWLLQDQKVELASFRMPFDYREKHGQLPPTRVDIPGLAGAVVSGNFSSQSPYATLDIVLDTIHYPALELDQHAVDLQLQISDQLLLRTSQDSNWRLKQQALRIGPTAINLANDQLSVDNSTVQVADLLTTELQGSYRLDTRRGTFMLGNPRPARSDLQHAVQLPNPTRLELGRDAKGTSFRLPEIGIRYRVKDRGGWLLSLDDLARLSAHSPVLERYRLKQGHCEANDEAAGFHFSCQVEYPDGPLVQNNQPVTSYRVRGQYADQALSLHVNDGLLSLKYQDSLSLSLKDCGLNLPLLFQLQGAAAEAQRDNQSGPPLSLDLQASNSFLYLSPERRIIADDLHFVTGAEKAIATLKHARGVAQLTLENEHFELHGQDFSAAFANALMTDSEFKGGELEFHGDGSFSNFTIAAKINNTLVTKYRLLNNILAFLNTIPGLLTLQLPAYDSTGLPASEIYGSLNYQDGKGTLTSVTMQSKELSLRGEGEIDFKNQTIDSTFNVIFGFKKSVGKVPLLGYVLVGDKQQPSITVSASGDLHDPRVSNSAFRQVTTYPFTILKRTITLPVHLLRSGQPADTQQPPVVEKSGPDHEQPDFLQD